MKKRKAKKRNLGPSYKLRELKSSLNHYDYSEYYSGKLYKNDLFIIDFYEHPIEGGYYPNGIPFSKREYRRFLETVNRLKKCCKNVNNTWDELDLFNKGISELVTFHFKKTNN